jgi:hypothetical protein
MSLRPFRLTKMFLVYVMLATLFVNVSFPVLGQSAAPNLPGGGDASANVYFPIVLKPTLNIDAPRVNAPFIDAALSIFNWTFSQTAIFWFGKVTLSDNYADVRTAYNSQELFVDLAIFDRRTWYDATPSPADLTAWDAVSLYLDLNGNRGIAPVSSSYRFIGQLSDLGLDRLSYQQAARGNGTGWDVAAIPFTTETFGRGSPGGNNDDLDDKGWIISFHIPFSSLGLSAPPVQGTTWGLGLIMHDRDSAAGPPLPDKPWPKNLDPSRPATWGQVGFGLPVYSAPPSAYGGTVTVRDKLNGALVKDAEVGGNTTCGANSAPVYFNLWGDANYAGYTQVNVQNQADLSDWPCFSKLYLTFPLDALPVGKVIRSAKLTLYQFGGSDPTKAYSSLIQVLTVANDWDESTITWNNAPYAWENVSQNWVAVLPSNYPSVPGAARDWDISRAVADAYQRGIPLRLVVYSADGPAHSGKYFYSSKVDDYMPTSRPTLTVEWGN